MKLLNFIHAIKLLPQSRRHLIWVMGQLKIIGYQQVIAKHSTVYVNNESIHAIVKSYFLACRFIKNCDCLPRSIALYQCLKSAGYKIEHKFGVNKQNKNLAAHAWVEYKGEPLNESLDLYQRFTVLK